MWNASEYRNLAELACPICGSGYLHHGKVTLFHRNEDQSDIALINIEDATVSINIIPNCGSGNPSERRHGLVIEFSCEGGCGPLELILAQHKGSTQIGWRLKKLEAEYGGKAEVVRLPVETPRG